MAEPDQGSSNPEQPASTAAAVVPIVAIGASAGGLEALQALFAHVPADCGMAFVVVTHMRPRRESLLPELIAGVAKLPVVSVDEPIQVRANTIIVAKDSLLTITHGQLRAIKGDETPESTYHPIDFFFRALAADQHEHAIGVVLSGSGNDGTLGLKAIKAAGGMVMVQKPETAKYASMPDSAIATRLVDYILPPEEMATALAEYCRGAYLKLSRRVDRPTIPGDAIHAILVRLRAHTGQDFTCYKKSTMSRRIERRMNVHQIDEPQAYIGFLRDNPHELEILKQELLISVTSFFRDREAFESLAENGIARLLTDRPDGQTLRVWVPGCATGEEAYSVAILLEEQLRKLGRMHDVHVFATDLDEPAIEVARAGMYPEGIAADVSPERLAQYFSREDGAYRIHKSVRDRIVFATQNVISDPPFTRMDLIVCRNLLIYLDAAAQQRVLSGFHYALSPGGLLFLGSSESLGDADQLFEPLDNKHKILRRRETPAHIYPTFALPARATRTGEPVVGEPAATPTGLQIGRSIERLLLDQFAPCSLVVDDHGTAIYIHGRSGQFFQPEQGQPRNNVLTMAREGLASPLAAAIREAKRQQREVVHSGLMIRTNGHHIQADLTVRPLTTPSSLRGLLLVTLQPASAAVAPAQPEAVREPAGASPADASSHVELERELQHTRETLQTTIEELETSNEELKSSNEELQSINEELQSTNEELETSKEEMQSLNEELNTVNSELQSKVTALARSNDDMNNLLNSMQIAAVFLDSDMRVKRYTDQARDVVRLISSDIGRPLSDLTSKLDYANLSEDCGRVLATLAPKEMEVQDTEGRWYLVRLMPYRTSDNVIDGIVMTMVDIDRAKRAEREAAANKYFRGIFNTVRGPLLVLDTHLRVVSANGAFYHIFRSQPSDTVGSLVYELGNRQWDIPDLRRLLEEILPAKAAMNDYRVEHEFPRLGRRVFILNARRIQQDPHEPDLILLAFEDVTERPA